MNTKIPIIFITLFFKKLNLNLRAKKVAYMLARVKHLCFNICRGIHINIYI